MQSVKCVLIGDGCVGKTCLCWRYVHGTFYKYYVPTIFENYSATETVDGNLVNMELWETAGEEAYDHLRPVFYPQTDVFLVCFSIDSPTSVENVLEKWIPEARHHVPSVPIILVGCKADLRNNATVKNQLQQHKQSPVSCEQGMKMAKQVGKFHFRTQENSNVGSPSLFQKCFQHRFQNQCN